MGEWSRRGNTAISAFANIAPIPAFPRFRGKEAYAPANIEELEND